MSTLEMGMSFGNFVFETRGRSSQKANKEKGDKNKKFQAEGLRGNGSKKREKSGLYQKATPKRPR